MKIRIITPITVNSLTVSQHDTVIEPINGEYEITPNTYTKIVATTDNAVYDEAEIFDDSEETVEWRLYV